MRQAFLLPHLTGEETEAVRWKITWPRSHSRESVRAGLYLRNIFIQDKDVVHTYNGILLSHSKKEITPFTETGMNLEIFIRSGVSQTEKDKTIWHHLQKESESEVSQLCPTLCDPMDCSLPCSTVHGIFQARVLEWVAIAFSRGSSQPEDQTRVSRIVGRCFTIRATREDLKYDHKWTSRQKQIHRHREQTCSCLRKEDGGGKEWEFGVNRCKRLYMEWINNKALPNSTGNYIQYSLISHIEKNVCICITESLWSTEEINTTL